MLRSLSIRLALIAATLAPLGCSRSQAEGPLSNEVTMTVTDNGFEPQNIRVHKGKPVTLVITRKTDATCATEIVIDEHGIKTPLPHNQPVTVRFTPNKTGQLKYGCAMNKMIGGVISVE